MYDDLDDLLPKRQTSTALENPFEDVFSSGRTTSVDPWSAMGGSGAGGFGVVDDWNTNVFADHESPFKHPENYGEAAAQETPKTGDMSTPTYEELPTPTAAVVTRDDHVQPSPVVESITPSVPVVAAVDPLDAAASNIEEEEVHVPVIRRKLPLLSSEPAPLPVPEPTPPEPAPAPPNESSPPKPAQVELDESETETPPPADSLSEETPRTPIIITHATPPAAETTPPGRRAPSPPPSKTTDPSTPSSHSSASASAFSEQAQSSSRQSSNIIVSPLETPPRASTAPLSHNYSGLPLGTDTGGWGGGFGGWGGDSSLPTTYGTEEVAATPSTETGSETETPSEKRAGSTDEEDVRTGFLLHVRYLT